MYKVNLKSIKDLKNLFIAKASIGLFFELIIFIPGLIKWLKINDSEGYVIIFGLIILTLYISYELSKVCKINCYIKKIKYLCKNGKLIKNLDFKVVKGKSDTYSLVHDVDWDEIKSKRIVVEYLMPDNKVIELQSHDRFDLEKYKDRDKVDLLIDENNTDNYYIDFDIESI